MGRSNLILHPGRPKILKMTSYEDAKEYEKALSIFDGTKQIFHMKQIADKGNVQACYWFAEVLMQGGYDITRMELDFVRKGLLQRTSDPTQDPYLIVPRDQFKALEYYKKCSNLAGSTVEAIKSGGLLAYCRAKKIDTEPGLKRKSDAFCVKQIESSIKKASPQDLASNPILPCPFKRPEIFHPRSKMFPNFATNLNTTNSIEFLVFFYTLFVAAFIDFFRNNLIFVAFRNYLNLVFFLFILPGIWFSIINYFYGIHQRMPLCSCPLMRKAYALRQEALPEDCRDSSEQDSPFVQTPWPIRNLYSARLVYPVSSLILAIIASIAYVLRTDFFIKNLNFDWIPLIILYALPLFMLFMHKNKFMQDRQCLLQLELASENVTVESV